VLPVNDLHLVSNCLSPGIFPGNLHTILEERIDLAVGMDQAHCPPVPGQFGDGKVDGFGGKIGVEFYQHRAELPYENNFFGSFPSLRAATGKKGFGVAVCGLPVHIRE